MTDAIFNLDGGDRRGEPLSVSFSGRIFFFKDRAKNKDLFLTPRAARTESWKELPFVASSCSTFRSFGILDKVGSIKCQSR